MKLESESTKENAIKSVVVRKKLPEEYWGRVEVVKDMADTVLYIKNNSNTDLVIKLVEPEVKMKLESELLKENGIKSVHVDRYRLGSEQRFYALIDGGDNHETRMICENALRSCGLYEESSFLSVDFITEEEAEKAARNLYEFLIKIISVDKTPKAPQASFSSDLLRENGIASICVKKTPPSFFVQAKFCESKSGVDALGLFYSAIEYFGEINDGYSTKSKALSCENTAITLAAEVFDFIEDKLGKVRLDKSCVISIDLCDTHGWMKSDDYVNKNTTEKEQTEPVAMVPEFPALALAMHPAQLKPWLGVS